jgi:opacity protein-like surface antigen
MQRVLLAGLGLLVFVCAGETAHADGPRDQSPLSWTGHYVGVDGGYLWSRSSLSVATPAKDGTAAPDPDGLVIGGHIGYRHQFSPGF